MYKLININTKEEHLCDKVTMDGFDYYFSETEQINWRDLVYNKETNDYFRRNVNAPLECNGIYFKIIATTNSNIDVPKVVDEVYSYYQEDSFEVAVDGHSSLTAYVAGYNKSQETHSNSDEDMIEFLNWVGEDGYPCIDSTKKGLWVLHPQEPKDFTPKELLQLWKEQKPKIVYYE